MTLNAMNGRPVVMFRKVQHRKNADIAVKVDHLFHGDDEFFLFGLIQVLPSELEADFRRTDLETDLLGLPLRLSVGSRAQAQCADADPDQIHRPLRARQARALAEVGSELIDYHALRADGIKKFGVRAVRTELNRLPHGKPEIGLYTNEWELISQKRLCVLCATELLDQSVHLAEGKIL